ncbi:PREDICTED: vetispiradiene synthase 3-like [Erythranthe guttata]|uniref:vetispiradiene synthase 3-like n=1 Tax=Erythranthe guttata TaxID=4155 RepID=UPI00064DE94A|nr:PREDICTED: vetispiradiene synthase 3-like [Erythranthe guttata]|eukprot:XP_012855790.1 PREDICTED: vetispiradiene synthase 3-like [Erythranthe guttata]
MAAASNEEANYNLASNPKSSDIVRPVIANFPPSLWDDRFTSFDMDIQLSSMYAEEIKVLKEEARNMLTSVDIKLSEKLVLIDTIERLGLSYHFENEIQEQLTLAFNGHLKLELDENNDLFITSLQFRLLRQHALDAPSLYACNNLLWHIHIYAAIFKRFTENKNGEFKKALCTEIEGVLSLYEATYLRRQGEEILDKAFSFSKAYLESVAPNLPELPLKKQVLHALDQSLHRGTPRVESRRFISLYEEVESKNESLLRLAKLDFNLLQMLHKNELSELTRWWKEMDLISKLSYARDRVVECYFWALGVYHEPQYSSARVMLAKTIAIISVIDDTYDTYGTIEELKVFTDAIQKWDIREIDRLPDYMKICYRVVLDLYEAFDAELSPKGRSFAVHYAREAMKEIVTSYYVEAKWFVEGDHLPLFDEYMSQAEITAGAYFLTITAYLGMDNATIEVFDWLLAKPNILKTCNVVVRIIDDVATYEDEKKRGQVATGIDCYMKEHGVSKQVAIQCLQEIVEVRWKDLNEGILDNSVSMEIRMRVFNWARVAEITYKRKQDGYTYPEKGLKPHVVALLLQSFEI